MDPMFARRSPENDTKEEDAYTYAMRLVSFSALPMTLRAAVELGLLRFISNAAGPLSSDELAAGLGLLSTNPHAATMIERILRLLASYSILSYSGSPGDEGRIVPRYGPTLVCKYFSPDENGASLDALALMFQDKIIMENWYHIKDAVVNGGTPFDMAYGMPVFDYTRKDSKFNDLLSRGMGDHSSIIMKKVLDAYQGFHDVNIVVDVGGGLGSTLNMIISGHSHIKGINFDLPHVISQAPPIPMLLLGLWNTSGPLVSHTGFAHVSLEESKCDPPSTSLGPTTAGVRGRLPPAEVPLTGQRAGVQGTASPSAAAYSFGGDTRYLVEIDPEDVQHIGGDMFDSIPSGDIIFTKWILHDWSDECCIKILKNCRKALPTGGKVVIVEYILPKSPEPTPEAQLVFHADMIMLGQISGGKERTEKEFEVLASQSGFVIFKQIYIASNACVMELSNE
ncbi:Tricetin 3',4',5'-O-trimethyltransferase [Platanthera zijinensis]|uniref:Tricetin 3',4',5'-O-trimethyltransferase n=1 Tax=Platanthera zijinensis TaxID=2320716 RepID=A0AAP0BPF4_9ASPA